MTLSNLYNIPIEDLVCVSWVENKLVSHEGELVRKTTLTTDQLEEI